MLPSLQTALTDFSAAVANIPNLVTFVIGSRMARADTNILLHARHVARTPSITSADTSAR